MTIAGVTNVADWNGARGTTVPLAAEDATERAHVIENFMAGKPTYGPDSKVGGGSNIFTRPVEVDVTSRYPGIELLSLSNVNTSPVYGISGSAQPIDVMATPGEFVLLADGQKMHYTKYGWVKGPTPTPGDKSTLYLASSYGSLAVLKADPSAGDDGTDAPNDPTGPDAAFKSGEFVVLADMTMAYWNGDVWLAGKAP
jgi:hypothetical protein